MDDYRRLSLAFFSCTAAVIASLLALSLPANVSAMLASVLAPFAVDKFKTDVDRILEPNDQTKKVVGVLCIPFGMLVAYTLAGPVGPAFAATFGVLAMVAAVAFMLGL